MLGCRESRAEKPPPLFKAELAGSRRNVTPSSAATADAALRAAMSSDSAPVEMLIELMPADADDAPGDVYHAAATLRLSTDLEWRGYATRELAYGLVIAVATARSWTGEVSAEELEDACAALPQVQNARVVSWTQCSDACPFDLAWLHPPLRISSPSFALQRAPPRLGLVSTFRSAPNLRSWVVLHLAMGVRAFHLYADSEADAAEARALAASLGRAGACVRVVAVDDELRREWEGLVGWSRYGPRLSEAGSAVMARQCLNAEHAMLAAGRALASERRRRAAGAEGAEGAEGEEAREEAREGAGTCDWLCHCDVDELVCVRPMLAARDSAGGAQEGGDDGLSDSDALGRLLASAQTAGASALLLANHEGALEAAADCAPGGATGEPRHALRAVPDCFAEVSLFKMNERLAGARPAVSGAPSDSAPSAGGASGAGEAPTVGGGARSESIFIQYNNGKSMARVGIGARPHGVHKWLVPGGGRSGVVLADPQVLSLLHYCDCGYPSFIEKYRQLGAYPNEWFGQGVLPFRLSARDAACADARSGGTGAMEALFRAEVLYGDGARVRAHISERRCARTTKVAGLLERLRGQCGQSVATGG